MVYKDPTFEKVTTFPAGTRVVIGGQVRGTVWGPGTLLFSTAVLVDGDTNPTNHSNYTIRPFTLLDEINEV